ncbi:unnamed protein product [Effrenium voratum]|nr:unnamed protein product [Effrenium voratum]
MPPMRGRGRGEGGGRGVVKLQKSDAKAQALTKKIAELAREKQLTKALEVFGQFELEGLEPSVYTFSSLINVHVRSGDLKGAKAALKAMRQRRLKPNVSIFTILLRGYSQAGNLRKARGLLDEMQREKVQPDARAMNTFLRGCLHHGQVALAKEVFNQMDSQWGVIPDYTSLRYMAQILGQALCIKDLKQLMQKVPGQKERAMRAPDVCKFWAAGRCSKGVNCTFYHDPSVTPANEENLEQERRTSIATMNLALAQAAAMLGRFKVCQAALQRAEECIGEDTRGLFQQLSQEELRREAQRIRDFAERALAPELLGHLFRTFLFGPGPDDPATLCEELMAFGLGTQPGRDEVLSALQRCFKGQRMRIGRTWGRELAKLPQKLEICAGNGDWVIAQAKEEHGVANWIALELRHDRVHNIFSRAPAS